MPGKHNTINQIPSLPSRRRQTCEQKMTTQGHIHNGRGQPRGHGSPEKGAQGAQEITLLASCSLCTIEDTNSLWDLRDITLTLWPWFLFFTQQSIWAQCFPRSYPMILTFLYLLLFGWIDTMPVFIISLMFFKRVEAFSELQASWSLGQKFWHWEVVSETSRRVQTFFFFWVSVLDMVRPTLGTLPAFLLSHEGGYTSWPLCQDMGLQWWTKTDAVPNLMEFAV